VYVRGMNGCVSVRQRAATTEDFFLEMLMCERGGWGGYVGKS
jgi:hypothetical protein